jgi:phosphoribosylglycinamide formyltransferase 1
MCADDGMSDDGKRQIRPRGGKLGVLISGRGSNLRAIIDAIRNGRLNAEIGVVISNRADAPGLEHARTAAIDAVHLDHRAYTSREAYDTALAAALRRRGVQLVCLAGFMRLLSREFIDAFPDGILNIHPSLLPAFPGLDAQAQAWNHGVKITGATVHLVTTDLDAGPILLQAPVPVLPGDTIQTLAQRILVEEHRLYPEAIELVLAGKFGIEGRRAVRLD